MVQGRAAGDLPLGLAGRRRREPRRRRRTPTRASTRRTARRRSCGGCNNALLRADQIDWSEGRRHVDWLAPIVADAEAGFGGPLQRLRADEGDDRSRRRRRPLRGPARVREEVRPPRRQGARADVAVRANARPRRGSPPTCSGVPTVLVARTDALSATLLTSDVDRGDAEFLTGERTAEGFFRVRDGLEPAIARSLAYAPYADVLWFETSTPDLGEAREFAEAIHERFPGKLLAYNCSPSFNWRRHLDDARSRRSSSELGELGYRFQFVTLAGFHALNASMFELAHGYARSGMTRVRRAPGARVRARGARLHGDAPPARGRRRLLRPRARRRSRGESSTLALTGSTEEAQFAAPRERAADVSPARRRRRPYAGGARASSRASTAS